MQIAPVDSASTPDEAKNEKVIGLCLHHIDECRPFFIGILGERYVWVPLKSPEDACKCFGWISASGIISVKR